MINSEKSNVDNETIVELFEKCEEKCKKDVVKTATYLTMGYITGGFLAMLYGGLPLSPIFGLIVGAYSVALIYNYFGKTTP